MYVHRKTLLCQLDIKMTTATHIYMYIIIVKSWLYKRLNHIYLKKSKLLFCLLLYGYWQGCRNRQYLIDC